VRGILANFSQSIEYLLDWGEIGLVVSAIDISNHPAAVDDQSCRVRDAKRIVPKSVIQTVGFCHRAILIEQKGKRNWMLAEIIRRLPKAVALFSRDIDQASTQFVQFCFVRLKLSQALAAVGSPGSAKKFDNHCSAGNHIDKRKSALAICGR